jgi:hypothetical protein
MLHRIAQTQLTKTSTHPAAATQIMICERGPLVMPRWSKTMAGIRGVEGGEKE